jgi:hypothetical protein
MDFTKIKYLYSNKCIIFISIKLLNKDESIFIKHPMKKIILVFSVISLFVNVSNAQDKAFHKGTINVDLGIGFAVYGTKTHQEYDTKQWNGTSIVDVRIKKDTNDAAASTIIPICVEYGLTDWFGIGARFGHSKYVANADSTNNNIKPSVRGLDADLLLNFHLVKGKHFDMPISLMVGYSNFRYKANNPNTAPIGSSDNGDAMAKDNGLNFGIALVPRIYFGEHFGMFFNLGYMAYRYPSIIFSNNSDSNLNDNNNELFKLKGNGGTIGIGLIGKF